MPDPLYGRSPDVDFDAFLQMTHLNKGTTSQDTGEGEATPGAGEKINFSFKAKISGPLEFTVQPGFAEVAPNTVIAVTCSIIQTVTATASVWYGWVDVDFDAGTAVASFGEAWPADLTTEQLATIRRRRIVQLVMTGGETNTISAIKNLQCGNIDIEPYAEAIFAFKGKKTAALEASIQPGSVELGASTELKWNGTCWVNGVQVATDRFTNSLTSGGLFVTPEAGNTRWYVWAEVDPRQDIDADIFPRWRLREGAAVDPLYNGGNTEELFHLDWARQRLVLEIALVDDVITTVKNLQCGNIDVEEYPYAEIPSSFDIKLVSAADITIRGGMVRWGGRGKVTVADTVVTPTGTAGSPSFALLKISTIGDTITATIEGASTDADDTGSDFYVTLWELYQVAGVAKVLKDRRHDIVLRSPI